MADSDVSEGLDIATIIGFAILGVVFTIGMGLQIKTIKALKQDRATAWEIDLSHSVVMMIHFSFVIVFEGTVVINLSLPTYLGEWICSASFVIRMVGASLIFCHSLTISFYKYLFIVHHNMMTNIGQNRMKKIICLVYLLLPISGCVSYLVRPNWRAMNAIHNCGVKEEKADVDLANRLFMCGIVDVAYDNTYDYFMGTLTGIVCTTQIILFMLVFSNILEVFSYIGIFRHIGRYVHPSPLMKQ